MHYACGVGVNSGGVGRCRFVTYFLCIQNIYHKNFVSPFQDLPGLFCVIDLLVHLYPYVPEQKLLFHLLILILNENLLSLLL